MYDACVYTRACVCVFLYACHRAYLCIFVQLRGLCAQFACICVRVKEEDRKVARRGSNFFDASVRNVLMGDKEKLKRKKRKID